MVDIYDIMTNCQFIELIACQLTANPIIYMVMFSIISYASFMKELNTLYAYFRCWLIVSSSFHIEIVYEFRIPQYSIVYQFGIGLMPLSCCFFYSFLFHFLYVRMHGNSKSTVHIWDCVSFYLSSIEISHWNWLKPFCSIILCTVQWKFSVSNYYENVRRSCRREITKQVLSHSNIVVIKGNWKPRFSISLQLFSSQLHLFMYCIKHLLVKLKEI